MRQTGRRVMWTGGSVFVAAATLEDMTHLSRTNPDLVAVMWIGVAVFTAGLLLFGSPDG